MANLRDLIGKRVHRTEPIIITSVLSSNIDKTYMNIDKNTCIIECVIGSVPILKNTNQNSRRPLPAVYDDNNWEDCTEIWEYCYGANEEDPDGVNTFDKICKRCKFSGNKNICDSCYPPSEYCPKEKTGESCR